MNLITTWCKRRQHEQEMAHFFALLEAETRLLQEVMIELAEVHVDAARMIRQNEAQQKEAAQDEQ